MVYNVTDHVAIKKHFYYGWVTEALVNWLVFFDKVYTSTPSQGLHSIKNEILGNVGMIPQAGQELEIKQRTYETWSIGVEVCKFAYDKTTEAATFPSSTQSSTTAGADIDVTIKVKPNNQAEETTITKTDDQTQRGSDSVTMEVTDSSSSGVPKFPASKILLMGLVIAMVCLILLGMWLLMCLCKAALSLEDNCEVGREVLT